VNIDDAKRRKVTGVRKFLLAIASIEFLLAIALVVNAAYSGNDSDAVPDTSSSTTSPQTTTPPIPIQTTTPPIPIVETDKILGAICTTVPDSYLNTGSTEGDVYTCERNGSQIFMQVNGPAELARFTSRFLGANGARLRKVIKTQLLCGDGWKLHFERPDGSPGDAGILYQKLSQAGIRSESCS